jgi:hypothetical protein
MTYKRFKYIFQALIQSFTHYRLSSSPQEIGNENIDGSSAWQNWTVRFTKLENPVFPDRTEMELNRKNQRASLQALIDFLPLCH